MDDFEVEYEHLGKRVKELRKERAISQEHLAGLEVTLGSVRRLENGDGNPTLKTLYVVAKNLNVDWMELFNYNKIRDKKEKEKKK